MITAYSLNVNLYEQYYLYPTVVFALHLHNNVDNLKGNNAVYNIDQSKFNSQVPQALNENNKRCLIPTFLIRIHKVFI